MWRPAPILLCELFGEPTRRRRRCEGVMLIRREIPEGVMLIRKGPARTLNGCGRAPRVAAVSTDTRRRKLFPPKADGETCFNWREETENISVGIKTAALVSLRGGVLCGCPLSGLCGRQQREFGPHIRVSVCCGPLSLSAYGEIELGRGPGIDRCRKF